MSLLGAAPVVDPVSRGRMLKKSLVAPYMKEGVKVSFSTPNWVPVPPLPQVKDSIPPCARCGHQAKAHHNATRCSVRGRWWRRCRCSGYLRSDSATPVAPGST